MSIKTNRFPQPHGAYRIMFFRFVMAAALLTGVALSPVAFSQNTDAAPSTGPSAAPSYNALADLLENEQTRDQLITQLRSLASKPQSETGGAQASTAGPVAVSPRPAPRRDSFSQRIADKIQGFSGKLFYDFAATAQVLRAIVTGQSIQGVDRQGWIARLGGFFAVFAVTVIAFLILRAIAALGYARLDDWVGRLRSSRGAAIGRPPGEPASTPAKLDFSAFSRAVGAIFFALVIDIAVIVLVAVIAYAFALFVVGPRGIVGVPESIFINAFVAVEITKALIRLVFATRYENLRLLPMATDIAIYWNQWLARLVGITGYGLLVAVPIMNMVFLPALAQLAGLFIMLGVYVYAVRVIWTNRTLLRTRLLQRAQAASTAFFGTLIRIFARIWHVLAIAYFTVLLVASQVEQQQALPFMARATIQMVFAVIVGLLLSSFVTALANRRIRLSDELRKHLPLLEDRINSYVPLALKTARTLILVAVLLVVLDAWHAFNLQAWIASDSGSAAINTAVHVAIILLIAALVWTVLASVIESRLSIAPGRGAPTEREKTLLALFRNAALVVIVTMTILVVLSQIGIDIGPLIAGAGVVGLAIGFGAQKLVQDVITGVFIQLENGMNQNDVVELCGLFGTVEKITIRSVVIRTLDGGYHLIPFSSVNQLANHMRGFGVHYSEYNIAHRENSDEVIRHLKLAFEELMQDPDLAPSVLEEISIPGVTSLSERGFTVRVLIKTVPGMQWAIQRGFNRLVKKRFDAAGIELPYPHSVIQFERDKSGYATPVNVRHIDMNADTRQGPDLPAPEAG